jgi:hypothetical protein
MTSVIASECLKKLGMNTLENILAVTFTSFFHDILLIDHPEVAKINSAHDLAMANLNSEDYNLAINHAMNASILIHKYPNVPKGVDKLIMEHHGVNHGISYSDNIELLDTLSKVFIIVHDFVLELMKVKENKKDNNPPRPISEELYKRYPTPSCIKIIKALEYSLAKKAKEQKK